MTKYTNSDDYTSGAIYQGSGGVYQRPSLRCNVVVSIKKAPSLSSRESVEWGGLSATHRVYKFGWSLANNVLFGVGFLWGEPYSVAHEYLAKYGSLGVVVDRNETLNWQESVGVGLEFSSRWSVACKAKIDVVAAWLKSSRVDAVMSSGFLTISHRYESEFYDNDYEYSSFWDYGLKRRQLALDGVAAVDWGGYGANKNESHISWGGGYSVVDVDAGLEWTGDVSPLPDQSAPAQPDVKEFYGMATDLTVVDVVTRTPLDISDVVMSLDVDSIAWTLRARVNNRASMEYAAPGRLIEISTVGWKWVFLVESYSRTRGVATQWAINAASQSRTLDAPWCDVSSYVEESVVTWKQAVESLMPLGWSVMFSNKVVDYSLPAGSWGYVDKTPKQALGELLDALGAVVIPDLSEKVLHIQPRYKYAPWEYDSVTTEPDAVVHEAMIFDESGQFHPANQHNGVWVSGTSRHGVVVNVEREGTDGQPAAADFYHDLITDVSVGQQKGKQLIAASGSKTLETIETCVTDEQASPGLIVPGALVEVQSEGAVWRGVCLSVSISGAGMPAIIQTIVVERHHGDNN